MKNKEIHQRLFSKERSLVEKSLERLGEKHPLETKEIIAQLYE